MPSKNPFVISIRGTGEYAEALEWLLEFVQLAHPDVRSFNQLALLALQQLAKRYRMTLPPHAAPRGRRPK